MFKSCKRLAQAIELKKQLTKSGYKTRLTIKSKQWAVQYG